MTGQSGILALPSVGKYEATEASYGCVSDEVSKVKRPYTRFNRCKMNRSNYAERNEISAFIDEILRKEHCINTNNTPVLCTCLHWANRRIDMIKKYLLDRLIKYYELDNSARFCHLISCVGSIIKSSSRGNPYIPLILLFDSMDLPKKFFAEKILICNNALATLYGLNKNKLPKLIHSSISLRNFAPVPVPTDEKNHIGSGAVDRLLPTSSGQGASGANIKMRLELGLDHHRNYIDKLISKAKRDKLLTFQRMNRTSFLHSYVDHQSNLPTESIQATIKCRLHWSIISRQLGVKEDVFSGENSINFSLKSDPKLILNSLIPLTTGDPNEQQYELVEEEERTVFSEEPVYCNGCNVRPLMSSVPEYVDPSSGLRYFVDCIEKSNDVDHQVFLFPEEKEQQQHPIHYCLVKDLLDEKLINKILRVCANYRHELVIPAIIFIMRFERERRRWVIRGKRMQSEKKIFLSKHKKEFEEVLNDIGAYLGSLGAALERRMSDVSISQLNSLCWGKWPLVLEDGDEFFDDDGQKKRRMTRKYIDPMYKTEDGFRDLHLLHIARIILFSQQS